jgi:hypothetical protein
MVVRLRSAYIGDRNLWRNVPTIGALSSVSWGSARVLYPILEEEE